MNRIVLPLLVLFVLAACGSGDPGFVRLGDYESDAGEAMVRHLIKILPELAPGVPKEYCVVAAKDMRSTSMDFVERMKDLKLSFVSADSMDTHRETALPVNPKNGLSPVIIQLAHMHKPDADTWDIEAGWAYKRLFERHNFRLKRTGKEWAVEDKGRVDGNYIPGQVNTP
ncbi:MAG: hypothetical protein JWO94_63 [Verrucomicrobiaceae bacterium]|nr:hypothetical protein [Verrucomicrobiaceae bacterium]